MSQDWESLETNKAKLVELTEEVAALNRKMAARKKPRKRKGK